MFHDSQTHTRPHWEAENPKFKNGLYKLDTYPLFGRQENRGKLKITQTKNHFIEDFFFFFFHIGL